MITLTNVLLRAKELSFPLTSKVFQAYTNQALAAAVNREQASV